jgi:hypothetical protein
MEEQGDDWFFICEEKMHSEEGEAAALKHIYMQSMAPTLEELSSASVQTVREKGVEWHERGAVTLGVAPSITPARAQPPASSPRTA